MRIKQASEISGVPADAIRHYEKAGLLAAPARGSNGYRRYAPADLQRLGFIRNCRALDMSLDEIRELLGWVDQPSPDCSGVDQVVSRHLGHVRAQLANLRVLERQLTGLLAACADAAPQERCRIVFELSSTDKPAEATRRRGVHTT